MFLSLKYLYLYTAIYIQSLLNHRLNTNRWSGWCVDAVLCLVEVTVVAEDATTCLFSLCCLWSKCLGWEGGCGKGCGITDVETRFRSGLLKERIWELVLIGVASLRLEDWGWLCVRISLVSLDWLKDVLDSSLLSDVGMICDGVGVSTTDCCCGAGGGASRTGPAFKLWKEHAVTSIYN